MTKIILMYLLIILVSFFPFVLAIAAGAVGRALGCRVDEANKYPCTYLGWDISGALYACFVMGWFSLVTVPTGIALAIGYTIYLMV